MAFHQGEWVWVAQEQNQELSDPGRFQGQHGDRFEIMMHDQKTVLVDPALVRAMDTSSLVPVDNLIALNDLHEGAILHNLVLRHQKDQIYTYVGNILLAMNPFKEIPIFNGETMRKYMGRSVGELPPHLYAIANEAYCTLLKNRSSQCIVISGESGAGKTEATKVIMNYLASVSPNKSLVQDQILDASPILEAFGNAKTVRNNNSSRFGKFLQMQFDVDGSIVGAQIRQYLLEKSRIVKQSVDERNYHVFYFLLSGAPAPLREKLHLHGEPQSYRYLNQSGCTVIPGQNHADQFQEMRHAMETLQFLEHEEKLYAAIAAVLHLGNVTFKPEVGKVDAVCIANPEVLTIISQLLDIDVKMLSQSLTCRKSVTRNESITIPLNEAQACDTRDALAKAIYGRMFSWMVDTVNGITHVEGEVPSIGVLDIFGFEDFQTNSFEQFCINFANERLQYYFNQFIFKLEQEEYTREGIDWSRVDFVDNQGTIDLISSKKPVGLLALLDEECNFPKATEASLLQKFHQNHGDHRSYIKPKTQTPLFGIRHYAGEVMYRVEGFLEKNKDTLPQDVSDMMLASKCFIVSQWFLPEPEVEPFVNKHVQNNSTLQLSEMPAGSGLLARKFKQELDKEQGGLAASGSPLGSTSSLRKKNSKFKTIGFQFTTSLTDLISTLKACDPYFVRCIKPNPQKLPNVIDRTMVRGQLKYCGVLETIRVRRAGYTFRMNITDFVHRYSILQPTLKQTMTDPRQICTALITTVARLDRHFWQLGTSKVFLRGSAETQLEQTRTEAIVSFVVQIQTVFRRWRCERMYERTKMATKTVERAYLHLLVRRRKKAVRRGIVRTQALWRGYKARKEYAISIKTMRELAAQAAKHAPPQQTVEQIAKVEAQLEITIQAELPPPIHSTSSLSLVSNEQPSDQFLAVQYVKRRKSHAEEKIPVMDAITEFTDYDVPALPEAVLQASKVLLVGPLQNPGEYNRLQMGVYSKRSAVPTPSNTDESTWTKFSQVYFRNTSIPTFTIRPLSESILLLPEEWNRIAVQVHPVLLRCVLEDLEPSILFLALHHVLDVVQRVCKSASLVAEETKLIDEVYCQVLRMTQNGREGSFGIRAWRIVSILLGILAPSPDLLRVISHMHAINSDPVDQIFHDLSHKLSRVAKKGCRREPLTSVEFVAHLKNVPILLEAEFGDEGGASYVFEVDALTTPQEVLFAITQQKGLVSEEGYQMVVECADGHEFPVQEYQAILDAVAQAEQHILQNHLQPIQHMETVRAVPPPLSQVQPMFPKRPMTTTPSVRMSMGLPANYPAPNHTLSRPSTPLLLQGERKESPMGSRDAVNELSELASNIERMFK